MELLIFIAGIALLALLGMYLAWPSEDPGERPEQSQKPVRRRGKA